MARERWWGDGECRQRERQRDTQGGRQREKNEEMAFVVNRKY